MSEYVDQFGITWEFEVVCVNNGWSIKWGNNDIETKPINDDCKGILNFTCE